MKNQNIVSDMREHIKNNWEDVHKEYQDKQRALTRYYLFTKEACQ